MKNMKNLSIFLLLFLVGIESYSSVRPSQKQAYRTKKKVHKTVTSKYKYDFKSLQSSPFSFHDSGMSDAEFFITNKESPTIQEEIERVQGSLSELDYTASISYEPRYLNQKPRTQKQKRSYLKGYLKILEEAVL